MEPAKTDTRLARNGTAMPAKPVEVMSEVEIIHWLREHQTPLAMVEPRVGRGGQVFYYLRHQYVTETLNRVCGFDWDFRVLRERMEEDQVTVLGELTIRVGERTIVKSQYGSSDVKRSGGKPLSIGDDFKSAASDALKKCASLLGLGLDLSIPIRPETMTRLHVVGGEVFGGNWKDARPELIRGLTGGKKRSSKDLLDVEARLLIAVFEGEKSSELLAETATALRPIAARYLRRAESRPQNS